MYVWACVRVCTNYRNVFFKLNELTLIIQSVYNPTYTLFVNDAHIFICRLGSYYFVQVIFYSSYLLFKLSFIQVIFYSNYLLFKLSFIQIIFYSNYLLFKLSFIQFVFYSSIFYSNYLLFKLSFIQVIFYSNYLLFKLSFIQVIFYSSYLLFKLYFLPLWLGGIRIQPTFALVRVVRDD